MQAFRTRPLDYALIDDRLPDGFGLDLVPALAEMRPTPAFAVISAHPSTERALRAWQRQIVIVPEAGLAERPAPADGVPPLAQARQAPRRPTRAARLDALPFGEFVLGPDGLITPKARSS